MRYLFNATYSTWFQPQKDCMHKICRQQRRCVQHHPVPDLYVCPACFYFYELYVNKIEKCKGHSRTKSIWNVILPQNLVLFLAHLSRRPWFALGMWPEMAPPWAGSAASNNSSSSDTKVVPDHSKRVTPDVNHLRVCCTVCIGSAGNLLCPVGHVALCGHHYLVKLTTTTIDWVSHLSFFIVWDFALQWIGPGPETRAFL